MDNNIEIIDHPEIKNECNTPIFSTIVINRIKQRNELLEKKNALLILKLYNKNHLLQNTKKNLKKFKNLYYNNKLIYKQYCQFMTYLSIYLLLLLTVYSLTLTVSIK